MEERFSKRPGDFRMTTNPIPIIDLNKPIKVGKRTILPQKILGRGGSGEVYYVEEGSRKLALKLFFPFYKVQQRPFLATLEDQEIKYELSLQAREYDFLSQISHPNIVKVIENGLLQIPKAQSKRLPIKDIDALPYLITEFIDGDPLNEALIKYDLSANHISQIFERLADALQHIHVTHKYLHTDIKSANILIRKSDFQPVLIDFALAKNLNSVEVNLTEVTKLVGDWDLFPRELSDTDRLKQIKEKDGRRQEILDLAFPALDLYQFGLVVKSAIPLLGKFEPREIEYLELLGNELTNWPHVRDWRERDLLPRVSRLGPGRYTFFGVPELTTPTGAERSIMIPPGQAVPITRDIQKVIDTRSFRRLGRINQLSLLSYVYPGAEYKRRLHVLYSYELTREFIYHLYATPLFRFVFDELATRQLLVCALLHDINHFPFLHTFQESRLPGLDKAKLLDLFCSGDLTGETALNKPSIYELLEDFKIDPARFKRLLFDKPSSQNTPADQAISSILNSGVDVDKLSYLFYDSYFTGVNYGKAIDYVGLLRAVQLGRIQDNNNCLHLCYDEGAIQALENVVMTRYWNFRSLYWHHTNRALMAMVLHVVREIFLSNKKKADWGEYLRGTLWLDDVAAVRWLNDRYREAYHKESILFGLVEDRNRLFRRLYTVRVGPRAERDAELYKKLSRLGLEGEKAFRARLAERLSDFIAKELQHGVGEPISTDEVLIDIPRRDMDSGGHVYVKTAEGPIRLLEDMSRPVAAINENYQMLAKRVRIFISPRISAAVDKAVRGEKRELIGKWIFDLLKDHGEGEVQ